MKNMTKEEVKGSLSVEQTPGSNQVLITKGMDISEILDYDKAGRNLVFDMVDFPELSRVNLGKLSSSARMAYQQDLRSTQRVDSIIDDGGVPFAKKLEIISSSDPLARNALSLRKGAAKKLPRGTKHINAGVHEVEDLKSVGYRNAKPGEVDIVGSREKAGAVVLTDQKGNIDNVTMLVDKEDYDKHREAVRERSQARLGTNLESTKERMKRYNPKVTIYDDSDLVRHQ